LKSIRLPQSATGSEWVAVLQVTQPRFLHVKLRIGFGLPGTVKWF
jgi:hypothetical protein